jgi:4'-phosphopantetheinyl transferase EntD
VARRDPVTPLFAPLLPEGFTFVARAIAGDEPPLFPEERAFITRVVAKRRRAFAFGRACARAALRLDVAIPIGKGGAPVWPPGITGSITHTDEHAAAVIGRIPIGIDLESLANAARTPDLLAMVALPSEREQPAALVFSAKESVYKCLYPTAGHFLDFHDVELAFGDGTFTVLRAAGYAQPVQGRFAIGADHVATVAIISDPRLR